MNNDKNKLFTNYRNYILSDDLMITARPWTYADFWNCESCPAIRQLEQQDLSANYPKVSLLIGSSGVGKTSLARVRGMYASCDSLRDLSLAAWRQEQRSPCGTCPGCLGVQRGGGWNHSGYFEIDGTDRDMVGERLDQVLKATHHHKWHGSNHTPLVVAIHEAVDVPIQVMARLKTLIESEERLRFMILVRDNELKSLSEPLRNRCRGNTYTLSAPTFDECVRGLRRVAECAGASVAVDVASRMVELCNAEPRSLLAMLHRTRPYWPDAITMDVIEGMSRF